MRYASFQSPRLHTIILQGCWKPSTHVSCLTLAHRNHGIRLNSPRLRFPDLLQAIIRQVQHRSTWQPQAKVYWVYWQWSRQTPSHQEGFWKCLSRSWKHSSFLCMVFSSMKCLVPSTQNLCPLRQEMCSRKKSSVLTIYQKSKPLLPYWTPAEAFEETTIGW